MNLKKCKEIRRAVRALTVGLPWQAYVQEALPQSNREGAYRQALHPQCGKARYQGIKRDIKRHGG